MDVCQGLNPSHIPGFFFRSDFLHISHFSAGSAGVVRVAENLQTKVRKFARVYAKV
ncbi:hypothetical protein MTR_3g047550 [Medicago truncatula]|uniref:Uncharacterized protein n=1 Tax=Medicago truncatula TaxID=3880 RepID=G7IXV2_MEDTR|nr:hypothetical protein MTR_3g047550 [Medicago truncatula]